ncbi:MAG TPA: zf-TFIIB domain-containing protein [Myxococcales bacterium]|nr:zf-TFIIB domain-containing protein [Myxococcales bacterium]
MPATAAKKTPPKKTPTKKPAARKAARSAKPPARKHKNGAMKKAQIFEMQAATDAVRAESDRLQQVLREKDELLQLGQQRITSLETELDQVKSNGKPQDALEQQLREMQARLTTRQAELEAARAEAENLKEAVSRTRAPGEPGNLRCPRCGGKMTAQLVDGVRADRCDACHGIFFDNGELENVIKKHDAAKAEGKGWFSGIFGNKPKS